MNAAGEKFLISRETQDFQTSRIAFLSNAIDSSRKWTSTITETATPPVATMPTDYSGLWSDRGGCGMK
jgi:hypothetical protein